MRSRAAKREGKNGLDSSGNFETFEYDDDDDKSNHRIRNNNNRSFSRAMLKDSVSRRASLEMKVDRHSSMSSSLYYDVRNNVSRANRKEDDDDDDAVVVEARNNDQLSNGRFKTRAEKGGGLDDVSGDCFETFHGEIDLVVKKTFGRAMPKDGVSRRASSLERKKVNSSMSSLYDTSNQVGDDGQDQSGRNNASLANRDDELDDEVATVNTFDDEIDLVVKKTFGKVMMKDGVSRRASLERKVNSTCSLYDMGNNSSSRSDDELDILGTVETFDDEIDLRVRNSFGRVMLKDSVARRASLEMKVNSFSLSLNDLDIVADNSKVGEYGMHSVSNLMD